MLSVQLCGEETVVNDVEERSREYRFGSAMVSLIRIRQPGSDKIDPGL